MESLKFDTEFGPVEVPYDQVIKDLTVSLSRGVGQREANDVLKLIEARRNHVDIPDGVTIAELLLESDEPLKYRVEELWPAEGRVILAAARKAGKTTTVGNISRTLVDGGLLFGKFGVTTVSQGKRLSLLDFEMSRNMLRAWYRELGVQRTEAVKLWPLRGKAGTFDIRLPEVRTEWARRLVEADTEVLAIDCLEPIFNALGIDGDKNAQVGPLLDALDALLVEAGITDCLAAHHMGHAAERSRGASRLRDWPEVEWKLVRERDDDGVEVDNGARFFSAYGRDVDVDESRLEFDTDRRLVMTGGQTRAQTKAQRADDSAWEAACIVHDAVAAGEELKIGEVQERLKVSQSNKKTAATTKARGRDWITTRRVGTAQLCDVGSKFADERAKRQATAGYAWMDGTKGKQS